jgi:alpha-beta hydrolase superfamily lysophospholipase
VTQGLKDHVCPPEYLQNLLQDRNIPPLTLREFPNALHEPFADDTKSEVFLAVTQWLEQINGL